MTKNEMRNLAKSFTYAFRGLAYCVKSERNMRIHLCAVVLVSFFSWFYGLEKNGYLVLFLCFGFVIAAEAFNTAVETMVNLESPSYHQFARIAKDVAAGAVFVAAVTSVIVGAILILGDWGRLLSTLLSIVCNPVACPVLLVLIALSVLFIFNGARLLGDKPQEQGNTRNFDETAPKS